MTHIHVIDGDAAMRLTVRRVLEPAGFAVTEAASEEYVAPISPELVIAAVTAARLAAIRRRHPGTRILTINDAGIAPTEGRLLAGELDKPFTPSQLLGAVRRCLALPRATTGRRGR